LIHGYYAFLSVNAPAELSLEYSLPVFAVNLVHAIPPRLHHGWPDEFVTDVALG